MTQGDWLAANVATCPTLKGRDDTPTAPSRVSTRLVPSALMGPHVPWGANLPLQGRGMRVALSQGVALGYNISPLWGWVSGDISECAIAGVALLISHACMVRMHLDSKSSAILASRETGAKSTLF